MEGVALPLYRDSTKAKYPNLSHPEMYTRFEVALTLRDTYLIFMVKGSPYRNHSNQSNDVRTVGVAVKSVPRGALRTKSCLESELKLLL